MKGKARKRTIFILLVVITWLTLSFTIESRALLFDDINVKGVTRITLRISSDVEKDDIKEMVYQASRKTIQSIDIQASDASSSEMIVRMAYMDKNRTQDLTDRLRNEYGNGVEVLAAESIGGMISLKIRNGMFAALGVAVATIIILLVLYVKALKSGD